MSALVKPTPTTRDVILAAIEAQKDISLVERAELLHTQALEMLLRLYKADHPDVATVLDHAANGPVTRTSRTIPYISDEEAW